MNNVMFSSVTFNWRDIISPPSYALVRNNLKMSDGFLIPVGLCWRKVFRNGYILRKARTAIHGEYLSPV